MTIHRYVSLGKSGLRVSPFCLGAMTFGQDAWGTDATASQQILDRYVDRGGNFVDTANNYARGWSERILGDHLAGQSSKRTRLVLATKFVSNLFPGDPNGGGAGRKAIHAQLEGSLRRLRTDYVDLYWMHAWDRLTPMEETLRALDDLVRAGHVRYIGFSDTPAWKVAESHVTTTFRGWTVPIALQIEYSLLERTADRELLPAAAGLGLGITVWSPLKNGILAGKYSRRDKGTHTPQRKFILPTLSDDATYRVVDTAAKVAAELGVSTAAVALAWVRDRPGVSSVILGARTIEQLDQNLDALDLELGAEPTRALDAASRPSLGFPGDLLEFFPRVAYGDTNIDGIEYLATPYAPKSDSERA
jgi:aryl-alcohol dehydrogenase-like predicted oxidoreductase